MIAISGALLTALEAGTASAVKKDGKEAAFADSFQKAANDASILGGPGPKTQQGSSPGKKGTATGSTRQRQTQATAKNASASTVLSARRTIAGAATGSVAAGEEDATSGKGVVAAEDGQEPTAKSSGDQTTKATGQVVATTGSDVSLTKTESGTAQGVLSAEGAAISAKQAQPAAETDATQGQWVQAAGEVTVASLKAVTTDRIGNEIVARQWHDGPHLGEIAAGTAIHTPSSTGSVVEPEEAVSIESAAALRTAQRQDGVSGDSLEANSFVVAAQPDVPVSHPFGASGSRIELSATGAKDGALRGTTASSAKAILKPEVQSDRSAGTRRAVMARAETGSGFQSVSPQDSWSVPPVGPLTVDAVPLRVVASSVAAVEVGPAESVPQARFKDAASDSRELTTAAVGTGVIRANWKDDRAVPGGAIQAAPPATVRGLIEQSAEGVSNSSIPFSTAQEDVSAVKVSHGNKDSGPVAKEGPVSDPVTTAAASRVFKGLQGAQDLNVRSEIGFDASQSAASVETLSSNVPATSVNGLQNGAAPAKRFSLQPSTSQQSAVVEQVSSLEPSVPAAAGTTGRRKESGTDGLVDVSASPAIVATAQDEVLTKRSVPSVAEAGLKGSDAFRSVKAASVSSSISAEGRSNGVAGDGKTAIDAHAATQPDDAIALQAPPAASGGAGISPVHAQDDSDMTRPELLSTAGASVRRGSGIMPAKDRKAAGGQTKVEDGGVVAAKVAGSSGAPVHGPEMVASASSHVSAERRAGDGGAEAIHAAPFAGGEVAASDGRVTAVQHIAIPAEANVAVRSALASSNLSEVAPAPLHGALAGDSLVSPMAHTTLEASPTVLEVGVPGGTHGWLKIRAEIGEGGAVQASMSAATHAGQETLRRELPAINAFLENERVPVSVQVAHAPGVAAAAADAFLPGKEGSLNMSGNTDQPAGREQTSAGTGGDSGDAGAGRREQEATPSSDVGGRAVRQGRMADDVEWKPLGSYSNGSVANGGNWLNVMA